MLGGARGTNEDAFAWARLADAIGIDHRDAQVGDGLPAELLDLPRATIDEAAAAKTIVLLGPDLKEELPVLYLRLRHAAEQRRSRILELGPIETGLTRYAWRSVRVETGSRARLGVALADPAVQEQLASGPVVVVAGRANLAESAESAMSALRTVLDACPGATVLPALRRGNVVGALQLGLTAARCGLRRARHPGGGRRRSHGPARPARRRPDRRLPRCRSRPPGARRRPPGDRRGHVSHRVVPPGGRRARRGGVR